MASYDDDGYDYDEGDSNTQDDDDAMREAMQKLRVAMGSDIRAIPHDKQADALWNYYYDIDKAKSYLLKKYPPPQQTPTKAGELFFTRNCNHVFPLGFSTERSGRALGSTHAFGAPSTPFAPLSPKPLSGFEDFFADMPWLSIPEHRRTVFVEPCLPRGGLLGGGDGAKSSKLQALAAARKKKAAEKKVDKVTAGLSSVALSDKKENQKPEAPPSKTPESLLATGNETRPALMEIGPPKVEKKKETRIEKTPVEETPRAAVPSAFGATLCGPSSSLDRTLRGNPSISLSVEPSTILPFYLSSPHFTADAFSRPSPDDVILEAQSKGSAYKKAKTSH